jgi:predicted DNA-binding mobile mystery protein A
MQHMRSGEMRERTLKWLDRSLRGWDCSEGAPPPGGWLRVTRVALGMTSRQLAARLGVSKSAVTSAECAEVAGTVSLATLERYAAGLECGLVYVLVPHAGSLRELLEQRAEAHYRATHDVADDDAIRLLKRRIGLRNLSSLWGGKMRR